MVGNIVVASHGSDGQAGLSETQKEREGGTFLELKLCDLTRVLDTRTIPTGPTTGTMLVRCVGRLELVVSSASCDDEIGEGVRNQEWNGGRNIRPINAGTRSTYNWQRTRELFRELPFEQVVGRTTTKGPNW